MSPHVMFWTFSLPLLWPPHAVDSGFFRGKALVISPGILLSVQQARRSACIGCNPHFPGFIFHSTELEGIVLGNLLLALDPYLLPHLLLHRGKNGDLIDDLSPFCALESVSFLPISGLGTIIPILRSLASPHLGRVVSVLYSCLNSDTQEPFREMEALNSEVGSQYLGSVLLLLEVQVKRKCIEAVILNNPEGCKYQNRSQITTERTSRTEGGLVQEKAALQGTLASIVVNDFKSEQPPRLAQGWHSYGANAAAALKVFDCGYRYTWDLVMHHSSGEQKFDRLIPFDIEFLRGTANNPVRRSPEVLWTITLLNVDWSTHHSAITALSSIRYITVFWRNVRG
ncbi:hypothetical protein L218DRAFT_949640 [Marasmius fiardii PR-910]|nr:hypothetical protein L218DRAFT_949640 [Marasmius fiardii PR-910]